jgi:hypothetical protein
MGFSRVWLTPHIMEDVPNTPDGLRRRFAELKNAYSGPIELRLAAENMIDPLFEKRLADGDLLPIGERGDHLLVETSYVNAPVRFRELLTEASSPCSPIRNATATWTSGITVGSRKTT